MEEPKVPAIGVSPCVKLFMESLFTDSLFTESMIAEAFSIGADYVPDVRDAQTRAWPGLAGHFRGECDPAS